MALSLGYKNKDKEGAIMAHNFLSLFEPLMSLVFNDSPYAVMIDKGKGDEVAQTIRDYAKNLTDKQVEEFNEYINEEEL